MATFLISLAMTLLALGAALGLRAWIERQYEPLIYAVTDQVPPQPVALVFGAGVWPSGRLSDALRDRMDTAIDLYQAGAVNKLLLTGDNRVAEYNEPAAMADYARQRGVPDEDLVLDYAGRRTYDSCYRAGAVFGVERAVLITQAFHLPRALFTCEGLGLQVVGLLADRHQYARTSWYQVRELAATARAWLDLNLVRPLPVLGSPIFVDWTMRTGEGS